MKTRHFVAALPLVCITFLASADHGMHKNLLNALEMHDEQKRPLFLYFTSSSCKDCPALDGYFGQQEVQAALRRNYIPVEVNVETFDGRACAGMYKISSVPAVLIVEAPGKVVYQSGPGITSEISKLIDTDLATLRRSSTPMSKTQPAAIKDTYTAPVRPAEAWEGRSSTKPYALQLGFFSSASNAQQMMDEASGHRLPYLRMQPVQRDGRTFYRVLSGHYTDAPEAEHQASGVRRMGMQVSIFRE